MYTHTFTTTIYFDNPFRRLLCLDKKALVTYRLVLRAGVELGAIMLWFYVADRTDTIASGVKVNLMKQCCCCCFGHTAFEVAKQLYLCTYSKQTHPKNPFKHQHIQTYIRDLFLFIFVVLTLVAAFYTMRKARAPSLANRQQTEEWKGWMQVLFLLYHYYEAREAYNAIRVFIASYVWMTGFGNFVYYYKTRDFSIGRFCQMMWRLNMLVIVVCCTLDNSYMLYYICPMHTLFTIMVYASLGLWRKGLDSSVGVWTKIIGCFVVVVIGWEFQSVFYTFWRPTLMLMGYTDPRRPTADLMHGMFFRDKLLFLICQSRKR